MDLGLSYLSLDRAASTLSTGERQTDAAGKSRKKPYDRCIVRAGRAIHRICILPILMGLNAVMHDLIADGNSVLLVDHDTQILPEV